jgi:hypothetical protein
LRFWWEGTIRTLRKEDPGRSLSDGRFARGAQNRHGWFLLLGIVWICLSAPTLLAQEGVSREYTIKAAYLYNLGRYVEWPASVFADAKSPFVIGVLEPDPFRQDLDAIAQLKNVNGRSIQVRRFAKAEEVTACHILFLPHTISPQNEQIVLKRVSGKHVLLVGESEAFLNRGGVVNFSVVDNKVRLEVALPAARRESLQFSAKLLQLAQIVN